MTAGEPANGLEAAIARLAEEIRKERVRSWRLLASIVDSSDDAIISKTADGVITSWNKAAERIYGWTAEEAVGRPMDILFPPERLGEMDGILRTVAAGGRVDHFVTARMTKDGREIWVSVTVSPVRDADDKVVGASSIARELR